MKNTILSTYPIFLKHPPEKTQRLLKRNGVVAHCAMGEMEGIELLTDKWKIKEMLLEDRHVLCALLRNNGR